MANEFAGMPAIANAFSPDVFADEAVGFELINSVLRITFGTFKMVDAVPQSDTQLVVVGRLAITVPGAQRLALALFDYLKREGLDPALAVPTEGKAH